MTTKEVVKLIEEERACFNNIRELKSITRGEHHLLKLFTLSLDKIQVGIESDVDQFITEVENKSILRRV